MTGKLKFGLIVSLFLVLGGLLVPFTNFAPNQNIYLIKKNMELQKIEVLAQGVDTLYYQWQSWIYIVLAVFLILIFAVIIVCLLDMFFDKAKKLAVLDYKQSQEEFEQKTRNQLREEIRTREVEARAMCRDAEEREKMAQRRIYEYHELIRELKVQKVTNAKQNVRIKQREKILQEFFNDGNYCIYRAETQSERLTFKDVMALVRNKKGEKTKISDRLMIGDPTKD